MVYRLKKLLYKILPTSWYLACMQRGFFLLFDLGILKRDARFKFHYAAKTLLTETDVVVDIGANLGYFSKLFARKITHGKLYAFEPIPDFHRRLSILLRPFPNTELVHAALGAEAGILPMVMPVQSGVLRTGLPHIISEEEARNHAAVQRVKVLEAKEFFSQLPKLDYVKCDIEGYEWKVFSTLELELQRLRPVVQIEISEKFIVEFCAFFHRMGYVQCGLYEGQLVQENGTQRETSDFLFVPQEKLDHIFATFNR
ncbi:MAG: FkbM family methyltransferase [Bacteroidota bacterium]